jgi:hypothetical protein
MTDMDDLDQLLTTASQQRDLPSAALVARIVQDADRVQPQPAARFSAPPAAAPRLGWFAVLADWFGGGVPLAGISAAALVGLYLGVAQPTPVLALADLVTGQTSMERLQVLPETGTLWSQE